MPLLDALSKQNYRCRTDFDHPLSMQRTTVANRIIVDVYNKIAGVSTVLAGLMSAVAVVGAKISNNQHKVDQSWDWLKRIWIAWAVINGWIKYRLSPGQPAGNRKDPL